MNDIPKDIKNRLANIKKLHMIGIEQEMLGTDMNRLASMLLYDASIEHLLNTILDFFEFHLEKQREENFSTIWKNVNSSLEENNIKFGNRHALPSAREIHNLHKIRNDAQHYAIIPDIKSLQQFKDTSERFLDNVIFEIFKIHYSEISLCMLIQNDDVKKIMESAEKCFFDDKFEESMKLAYTAFGIAKSDEKERIFGGGFKWHKLDAEDLRHTPFKRQYDTLMDLIEHIEILELRLDYKKYIYFKRLCPEPVMDAMSPNPGGIDHWDGDSKNYTHDNALFCLNFAIETILKWESFKLPTVLEVSLTL